MAHQLPSAPLGVTTVMVPPETVNFGSVRPVCEVKKIPHGSYTVASGVYRDLRWVGSDNETEAA